ncbi:MAG: glycosyl hydrolase family 28 protein [Rikenellaceae bacterium]
MKFSILNHLSRLMVMAAICVTTVSCGEPVAQTFKIYPAPEGIELSTDYKVEVEGCEVPLYRVIIPDSIPIPRLTGSTGSHGVASMAMFDMADKVAVKVTSPQKIEEVKILPTSYNIQYTVQGSELTFDMDRPMHLTVEINGEWHESLHISASPFETDIPDPNDENVIYFGPGVHDITTVEVKDNQTVYIAGGAYIRCGMEQEEPEVVLGQRRMIPPSFLIKGENVTFRGRGIIDGGAIPRAKRRYMLLVQDSKNVNIEGVTFFDPSRWTMPVKNSDNVHIDNIIITGWRGNSDGVDISNSRDVLVENSFFRTLDDLVVIKTYGGLGEARNIHVRKCVLWNELAHALSVGAEVRENVTNVLFEDCDVIHDVGRETALRVYHCDSAVISNIVFDNIRIEEGRRLISMWIGKTRWTETPDRGHIKDIVFRNITTTSAPIDPTLTGFQDATDWKPYIIKDQASIEIIGWDKDHIVDGVLFENVVIDGKKIDEQSITVQNEFIDNIVFK